MASWPNQKISAMSSSDKDAASAKEVPSISSVTTEPADNAAAGLEDAGQIKGKYVVSVEVSGPIITVTYGNDAHAAIDTQSVTLTVADNDGSLIWACAGAGIAPKHLPAACR